MPRASELKNGMLIDINGVPHIVKQIEVKSPSARGAATLYKIRYNNMQSGQKLDETYKGDDIVKDADCGKVPVQYSYQDADNWVFMNTNDYSQYEIPNADMEDFSPYITEGLEGMLGLMMDGKLLTLILPAQVASRRCRKCAAPPPPAAPSPPNSAPALKYRCLSIWSRASW